MVRIRKLAARDYRAVKKMERIIVDEYLGYLKETGEEDTIEPWITPEYFNHYVRAEASYVAEIARKLVGFILVQPTSFVQCAKRNLARIYSRPAHEQKERDWNHADINRNRVREHSRHFSPLHDTESQQQGVDSIPHDAWFRGQRLEGSNQEAESLTYQISYQLRNVNFC